MLDNDRWVKMVLGEGGQVNMKRLYGIDTINYAWVQDYVRDKKIREEIEEIQAEIKKVNNSLIHKDELKKLLINRLKGAKESLIDYLKCHLLQVQERKEALFGDYHIKRMPSAAFLSIFSQEIEDIFPDLPEGVAQQDIDKKSKELMNKIEKLKETIEKELSQRDRWVHFGTGLPVPYPRGCRWTQFVNDWKKVISRFEGGATIEGCALKSEEEYKAFYLLELDKVRKYTPLRKPFKT